jgi:hypothetical protein
MMLVLASDKGVTKSPVRGAMLHFVQFLPVERSGPMPRFGDANMNDLMFLTQLKFEIHDLNEVIMIASSVSFEDERAQIAAIPNLIPAIFKVSAIDVEYRLVANVRWSVMFHGETAEIAELLGEAI